MCKSPYNKVVSKVHLESKTNMQKITMGTKYLFLEKYKLPKTLGATYTYGTYSKRNKNVLQCVASELLTQDSLNLSQAS